MLISSKSCAIIKLNKENRNSLIHRPFSGYLYKKEGLFMKNNTIITISRQYGSGGRLIGQKLAERLGIPFYDKELITLAAEESGFAEHLFEKNDRNITNSLLYSLSMYGNTMGLYDMPLNDKLFIAQSKTIQSVAEKGPCVIVGRCADYVLRNKPNVLNVFIADYRKQGGFDRLTEKHLKAEKAAFDQLGFKWFFDMTPAQNQ